MKNRCFCVPKKHALIKLHFELCETFGAPAQNPDGMVIVTADDLCYNVSA